MEWADWQRLENGRYRNDRTGTELTFDGVTLAGTKSGVSFRVPMDVLVTLLGEGGIRVSDGQDP